MTMPVPIIAGWIIAYLGEKVKCLEKLPSMLNLTQSLLLTPERLDRARVAIASPKLTV
jgi:hypothetical protein